MYSPVFFWRTREREKSQCSRFTWSLKRCLGCHFKAWQLAYIPSILQMSNLLQFVLKNCGDLMCACQPPSSHSPPSLDDCVQLGFVLLLWTTVCDKQRTVGLHVKVRTQQLPWSHRNTLQGEMEYSEQISSSLGRWRLFIDPMVPSADPPLPSRPTENFCKSDTSSTISRSRD